MPVVLFQHFCTDPFNGLIELGVPEFGEGLQQFSVIKTYSGPGGFGRFSGK